MSRSLFVRAASAAAITGLGLLPLAGPASADPPQAQASANAATLTLVPVTTGTETATFPGTSPAGATPALSVLGNQNAITAGVLQQTATANSDLSSSACAGLVGNSAEIQVGDNGICSFNAGESGGVTIGGGIGVGVIAANAIVATCSADSSGALSGTTDLVDLTVLGQNLPLHPGVNSSVAGLIDLNTQTVSNGQLTVTALSIPAIGLKIGTVTCGPNAQTGVSSAFPTESWPIVLATLAALGLGYFGWSRRRAHRTAA